MKRYMISTIIFVFSITSCSPRNTPSNTNLLIPTLTHTLVSTPIKVTKEITPTAITPSPLLTKPTFPILTPNPIYIRHWKDYETALAKIYIPFFPVEQVLCEWDILGQSEDELYVWVLCMSTVLIGNTGSYSAASIPAVIHLYTDGKIQNIEVPGRNSGYVADTLKMFPTEVREKFDSYHFGRAKEMSEHIEYRRNHPDVPPSIVLITTPTP